MSGGPQVFLGATTFCVTCRQISGCREEHLLVPVCLVCPWAAARPLAVRAASFARRVVSKPGQAPPPPTGTAARPSCPSGALHTGGTWLLMASRRVCSKPGQSRRPRAPQPGPPVPTAPSTPVVPVVLMRVHVIAEPTPNSACNSPTTRSNPEIRSLELQRFLTLLKLHSIELHATFLRPGPATAHGHRSQARWFSRRPTHGGLAALGADCRRVGGVSRF